MPSRRLGRCDGHHRMVDCIGPLGAPEKMRPSRIGALLGHWCSAPEALAPCWLASQHNGEEIKKVPKGESAATTNQNCSGR